MRRHRVLQKQPVRRASAQGFNVWVVSINLLLLGALLVMALRIGPSYAEYLTIKDLITRVAAEYDSRSETLTDLRGRLAKLLSTNQIYDTSIDGIEIYRERGAIVIDANYEKRFPLFWILDGVMRFDDVIVETSPTGRT